jgi:hypothetical protein
MGSDKAEMIPGLNHRLWKYKNPGIWVLAIFE